MRTAWGSELGEGVDLDYVAFDEYDRMKDNVELAFSEGLRSSNYGYMRRWSTPSIPGRGINKVFQESDQNCYVWTCEHCGEKQFLTFEDNMIQVKPDGVDKSTEEIEDGTFVVGCKKCKKAINRWGVGEWVPQYPSRKEARGYHISQLDACWISADSIMRRSFKFPSKQIFINYVIGEAYSVGNTQIDDADVLASIRLPGWVPSRMADYPIISAGIDWGDTNWMTICGVRMDGTQDLLGIFWAEDSPGVPLYPVKIFLAILEAYQPNIVIADAGYGADRNTAMYTRYGSRFYACYWNTIKDSRTRISFKNKWNEMSREVTVDKTSSMQRLIYQFKGRSLGLPPLDDKLKILTKHLKNVRIMHEEEDGLIYQKATRVGPDHLACSTAYSMIGLDKLTNGGDASNQFSFDFL
jgi:hypothetical protein